MNWRLRLKTYVRSMATLEMLWLQEAITQDHVMQEEGEKK